MTWEVIKWPLEHVQEPTLAPRAELRYVFSVQSPHGGYGQYGRYPQAPKPSSGGLGLWIVAAVIMLLAFVGVIVGVAVWLTHKRSAAITATVSPKWSDLDSPVPVSSDDPVRGDRNAPVTIVSFEDLQDPFCKLWEGTLDSVRSHYGASKVRIVWKNYPISVHRNAQPAAEASRGVFMLGGNTAFWSFHDREIANQSTLDPSHFETWAGLDGVDGKKIKGGLIAHTWRVKVEDDHMLGGTLGVGGTPMSFINGIDVSGAQSLAAVEKIVDAELIATAALARKGTSADHVYVERSKVNFAIGHLSAAPSPPPPVDEPDLKVYVVPVGTSPTRGPATALVTIIEFSDFQCPYCGKVEPVLDRVRRDYATDVRIVWKNEPLPFHPRAEPAAELTLEARSEKGEAMFWTVHDALFADQLHIDTADLLALARKVGLNETLVSAALRTKKYDAQIQADIMLANVLGASGTPTFFLNGRKIVGAQPYETFKEMIDDEIVAAKAELAKGTSRTTLYDTLTARGSVPAP
ncbi:hypothetical protein BH09MYX1_BH09MYX1_40520 [soil metagenome]